MKKPTTTTTYIILKFSTYYFDLSKIPFKYHRNKQNIVRQQISLALASILNQTILIYKIV